MVKLSIIIPYYNTYEYTEKLLEKIMEQLTDEVEVIVVDDGCNEARLDNIVINQKNITILHRYENSGNASIPRNLGLDNAKGNYITFIDSDDMISDNYISKILKAIQGNPDIIFLSWENHIQKFIITMQPPKWNCAVWCRVYRRDIIGNIRFDENLRVAEDWKFNEQIKFKTKICIKDVVYYYNNGRKGSILNG